MQITATGRSLDTVLTYVSRRGESRVPQNLCRGIVPRPGSSRVRQHCGRPFTVPLAAALKFGACIRCCRGATHMYPPTALRNAVPTTMALKGRVGYSLSGSFFSLFARRSSSTAASSAPGEAIVFRPQLPRTLDVTTGG